MRVSKEAAERRNEILDSAEELFTTKGYIQTTVADILDRVGIAKGTFYYYFKSKEEVMHAIVMRVIDWDVEQAKAIAADSSKDPVEKIYAILMGQKPKENDRKNKLIEQFQQPSNAQMHQESMTQSILALSPILAEVVREGNEQGIFLAEYPRETMEFLMASGQVIFDTAVFSWTGEEIKRKMTAFIDMMEKALGASKGSFSYMIEILMRSQSTEGASHE